jgi:hypothetical protein
MGGGLPLKIMEKAKTMTAQEYSRIVFLGEYTELDASMNQSHNSLLRLQLVVARAIVSSIRQRLYDPLTRLQMKYDCISMVKNEMQSLGQLKNELKDIQQQMSTANKTKKMSKVTTLFKRKQGLWKRLQDEVDSILNSPAPFGVTNSEMIDLCCSKQSLQEEVLLHVQEVLLDASTNPELFSSDARCSKQNVTDPTLMKADKLLQKAIMGDLSPSCIPKRKESITSSGSDQQWQKVVFTKDGVKSRRAGAVKIQRSIRRYLAKRTSQKAEWSRVMEDLKAATIHKFQLSTIEEERRPSPPHRSTKDDHPRNLVDYFVVDDFPGHGHSEILGQINRVMSNEEDSAESLLNPPLPKKKSKQHPRRMSNQTATTAASTVSENGSITSTGCLDWKSPFILSASSSTTTPTVSPRRSRRSSAAGRGGGYSSGSSHHSRPSSIMVHKSPSSSSLDNNSLSNFSLGTFCSSSLRNGIRMVGSQSSFDSTNSSFFSICEEQQQEDESIKDSSLPRRTKKSETKNKKKGKVRENRKIRYIPSTKEEGTRWYPGTGTKPLDLKLPGLPKRSLSPVAPRRRRILNRSNNMLSKGAAATIGS